MIRKVLSVAVAVFAVVFMASVDAHAAGKPRTQPVVSAAATMPIRGADISFTLQEEAAGNRVTDGRQVAPIESVLAANGANYARLRVWVNPPAGYSTLSSALTLAQRAKAQGMRILVDLHYSDFWADPTYQSTPAAWAGQSLSQLAGTVNAYTTSTLRAFAAQGTPVDMIQIGNEISNGILWPVGQVQRADGEHWTELATLLNAGIHAVRGTSPATAIMLHIETGSDRARSRYVLDRIRSAGATDFDVIGLSYYAFWQSSLAALGDNLNALATVYGKPLIVVETSYPWTLDGTTSRSWVNSSRQLPEAKTYPATPQGQADFFTGLRSTLARVPNGLGLGYFDWEPGWLPPVTDHPSNGVTQWNLTMFDTRGVPLPSVRTAFAP